ncbi:MAG TPA: ComEC/Rec2 family competence protein [Candidatus Paceibacterota bacterium]
MPDHENAYYKKHRFALLALVLFAINIFLFYADFKSLNNGLVVAMLDIGQGDAIFIQSPTGTQVIFDAGPARSVLGPLARVMPPFDRTIDAIVITNPDADHVGGFMEILKNYKVSRVFKPGTFNDSKTYQNLEAEIRRQGIPDILARKGMRMRIGGGAVIDILFPDRDVSTWANNEGSVVARLVYGKTSVMLTGDATTLTEKIIIFGNDKANLKSRVLKVGHHGSRTSTGEAFLRAVAPAYAMISDGKNNKYGHPHRETLGTLESLGVKIFRTDLSGTIVMNSNGQNEVFSFNGYPSP